MDPARQYPLVIDSTLDMKVMASTDDAHDYPSLGSYFDTFWAARMGTSETTTDDAYAGFRFQNITIPQGADILAAQLRIKEQQAETQNFYVKVACDDVDNSPTFSSSNKPSQRTLTTAQVDWDCIFDWTAENWYSSPNLEPPVQEVIDRGGWSSRNALTVIIKDDGGVLDEGRTYYTVDNGSAYAPRLIIIYTTSSGFEENLTGDCGTWSSTTSLPIAMREQSTDAYNGYMYLTGGVNASNTTYNTTYYAPINSNGTLGSWTQTSSFTTQRRGHTCLAYNGYLYVLGGYTGSAATSSVQYAPINSNGTVGTWAATTSLPEAKTVQESAIAYNGYIYVLGGYKAPGSSYYVHYAVINSNGTLGSWTSTTSLPYDASWRCRAYDYFIYAVRQGYDKSELYYAPINIDGTIGSWTYKGPPPYKHSQHVSLITPNGSYYYIGGDVPATNRVQYIDVLQGVPGTWTETSNALPANRLWGTAAYYNGYIYYFGGAPTTNLADVVANVYYARLKSGGDVPPGGDWVINSTVVKNNEQMLVRGNVIMENGGTLDLQGTSILGFSGSPRYIYEYSGGTIYVNQGAQIGGNVTEGLVYSNDFSSAPGTFALGLHTHKIVDFPYVIGNFRLEYDWKTTGYPVTSWGFSWTVFPTQDKPAQWGMTDSVVYGVHYPDTDSGYNYAVFGGGANDSGIWGTPTTNTWYTIKITKQGTSGTWDLYYQGGSLLTSKSFTTKDWGFINRIAIGTWNITSMSESFSIESGALKVQIIRSGQGTDTSYIDNLKIYSLQ